MFSSGRGLVPTGKGRTCGGLLLCQGAHTFSHPGCAVRAARAPSPAQCLTPCRSPPVLITHCSLLAISPKNSGSHPSSCLLGQSVGNTWALSVGQLWEGLPASPISGEAPDLGLRGASPIPAVLGPGLGTLSLPHTDHCGGLLKVLGPPSSLVASVAVTLTDLQGSSQGH